MPVCGNSRKTQGVDAALARTWKTVGREIEHSPPRRDLHSISKRAESVVLAWEQLRDEMPHDAAGMLSELAALAWTSDLIGTSLDCALPRPAAVA